MSRLAPSELVCQVVDGIPEIDNCYPNLQPQNSPFPAVVYGASGRETEGTTDGPAARAQVIRVDVRGEDPGDLERFGDLIRSGIDAAGRLTRDGGALDDYDPVLKVHRHILTLAVRF